MDERSKAKLDRAFKAGYILECWHSREIDRYVAVLFIDTPMGDSNVGRGKTLGKAIKRALKGIDV